jgi:hypothetical protein
MAYKVYVGTSSNGEIMTASVPASASTIVAFALSGLTNGITYYFKVSAVQGISEGPLSTEVTATPKTSVVPPPALPTVPGAPMNLVATRDTNGDFVLTWTAPASDGGKPIYLYNVYFGWSAGSETLGIQTGSTRQALNFGDFQTPGIIFYVKITAMNEIGVGPYSNELCLTR